MNTSEEIRDLGDRSQQHCKSAVIVDRWHFLDKRMVPDVDLCEWGFGVSFCWFGLFRGVDIKIFCFNIYLGIWK